DGGTWQSAREVLRRVIWVENRQQQPDEVWRSRYRRRTRRHQWRRERKPRRGQARFGVRPGRRPTGNAEDKVEKLGGKTILPPTEVPGGPKLAMFTDPAGNVTGLFLRI